jgi:geranylgeranylglycerol-phosphate geranylgeranyltransferase
MMGAAVAIALGVASRWQGGVAEGLLIWAPLAGVAVTSAVMIVNDIVDLEAERVNAPWRPLPSGRVSLGEAYAAALTASALGLAFAALAGSLTLVSFVVVAGLGLAYNLYLKRTGLPGNIVVAALVASPFAYASAALGSVDPLTAIFASMVFLSVLARELVKGIPDIEGDLRAGVRTVAATMGPRAAARLAAALYAAAAALSILPLTLGLVNAKLYLPLIALLDALIALEAARLALRPPSREEAISHKNRVLVYMMVALLAITLGSMPG